MFNDKDDKTGYHPYAQHLWDRYPQRDGVAPRIHNVQMNTMFEGGTNSIGPGATVPVYQDASDWKEQWERNQDHETNYDFHSHRDIWGTGHTAMETRDNSDFSTAVVSDERYTACSMLETPVLDHNLLSLDSGLDGKRRSHSDTSDILTRPGRLSPAEPAPAISTYPGNSFTMRSDSPVYRQCSQDESTRSVASSQRLGPNPSLYVSAQWRSSYLPDVDGCPEIPIIVLKQDVTSERMMKASQLRRKKEGKYECPVTGCGSTFTRRINLKGHIRAHSDERPFVCSWVGCGKAFARLHDHKRHEQLHAIDRPFSCDGCKRTFARLDALNRHCEYASAITR